MIKDESGIYTEIVEKILDDPKNISTPKELYQQANACLRALESSDTNRDGIISTDEVAKLCEMMGLPMSELDDIEGEHVCVDVILSLLD